ncbi:unnamed protein product [Mytilus coruscus]|uniref:Uncharacterized protein n=1 Tax=Mytilus coruscus TaxID=42192 RepID=A0A6J8BK57_MYTCO|nr:unnamed protein product [Mytilus coruscus]
MPEVLINKVYSQKELTTIAQFMNLHKTLSDEKSTTRLKHASSYLLLTLVSNNSLGQSLAKKSLCLSDLLGLLRTSLPSVGRTDCWFDDAGTTGLELWSSVAAALCMCVNNPQNGLFYLCQNIEMFSTTKKYPQKQGRNEILLHLRLKWFSC